MNTLTALAGNASALAAGIMFGTQVVCGLAHRPAPGQPDDAVTSPLTLDQNYRAATDWRTPCWPPPSVTRWPD